MSEVTVLNPVLDWSGGVDNDDSNAPQGLDTPVSELRKVRERELMLKRLSGEISCAECRRYVLAMRIRELG